ncbi:MAG: ATP-dependent DNA ligase, partial [Actinomycetota bacterium]|nr:ATP-dependent DNA ligase [Actinomycetota bacterium]
RLDQAGLDGVVAKRLGLPYLPGSRDGVVKVKPYRTADCVIVGFRWSDKGEGRISTLLLGLYGDDDELDFVGHCSGFPAPVRRELEETLPKLQEPGHLSDKRIPGGQSRWSQGKELDWNPLRPELVCEVRYDKLEGNRFRHGTRFLRFRPDKEPAECIWDQVRSKRRRGDPTVESLLSV